MKKKIWTGERLETSIQNDTTIEHLHRYGIACSLSNGLEVLDIASGEGYGSNLLSLSSKKVIGVDISHEVINLAKKKYVRGNLEFKEGSATKIPIPDKSVDLVVSFETIEHHIQHEEMFEEIKRVLKSEGLLLMSSPDKKNYSDIPNYKNPFHAKELYVEEFKQLVKKHFTQANFFGQKIISGSLIIQDDESKGFILYKGNYAKIEEVENFAPVYNLCLASNGPLPSIPASIFDGNDINAIVLERAIKQVKSSWRYKIGNFLLSPTKFLKR